KGGNNRCAFRFCSRAAFLAARFVGGFFFSTTGFLLFQGTTKGNARYNPPRPMELPAGRLSQCLYNLFRMLLVFGTQEDFADDAFFIDDESGAMNAVVVATIQLLGTPYAILVDDLVFGIGQQG